MFDREKRYTRKKHWQGTMKWFEKWVLFLLLMKHNIVVSTKTQYKHWNPNKYKIKLNLKYTFIGRQTDTEDLNKRQCSLIWDGKKVFDRNLYRTQTNKLNNKLKTET